MLWPTICVDDFFKEPKKIKEFSNTLTFAKDPSGKWPGERTQFLHQINQEFVKFVSKKIMSILFPINYNDMQWEVEQTFQKINGNIYKNKGWVHTDSPFELTAIIYLSDHLKCGTSIFKRNSFFCEIINSKFKEKFYKETDKLSAENKYLDENNDRFEKIHTIESRFNRLIIFDSNHFHAAEKFNEENINEDRLTLISFFKNITGNFNKYPITEMNRV
jgi:hypothetical protein